MRKIKNHFLEHRTFISRLSVVLILMAIALITLIGKIIFLQLISHHTYTKLSDSNQIKTLYIPAPRGKIYSSDNQVIATNTPGFSLDITRENMSLDNLNEFIEKLGKLITLHPQEIKRFWMKTKYINKYRPITIKSKLSSKEVAKFSVNNYKFPQAQIKARLFRYYPYNNLFAHSVGYVGPVNEQELQQNIKAAYQYQIGKTGVEKFYEEELCGFPGVKKVIVDARGKIVKTLSYIPPTPGNNMVLNLNLQLQKIAHQEIKKKGPGAIVITKPQTGAVLSLISYPDFNPNWLSRGVSQKSYQQLADNSKRPLFNRAISGLYPPGSTLKPIVALEALESKIMSITDKFNDKGWYQLDSSSRKYYDWMKKGRGEITISEGIYQSCTTLFYDLSNKLGIQKLSSLYNKFGLGNKVDVDLPNEFSGVVGSPEWKKSNYGENWFKGETLIAGIGQGFTLVTPLQIASMTGAIASGNISSLKLAKISEASKFQIPYSLENLNHIRAAMLKTTTNPKGTAFYAFMHKNQDVAGKTGTAQVYSSRGLNLKPHDKHHPHAWFTAFYPAKNPSKVITCVLEHNKGASRVVSKIISEYENVKKN